VRKSKLAYQVWDNERFIKNLWNFNRQSEVEILNYTAKLQNVVDFDSYHNVGKNWFVKVIR